MTQIKEDLNLKEDEYIYDCGNDVVTCKHKDKIEGFKLIHINESINKIVYLMCRKDSYKFTVRVVNFRNYYYKEDEKGEYISFDRRTKLKKILKNNNEWISKENQGFENDISNSYRFSIDCIDKFEIEKDCSKYRIMYLDIETGSSVDVINAPEPIISISYIDSFTNNKFFMMWHKEIKKDKFIKNNITNLLFETEEEMLKYFLQEYQLYDIITGWNILGFDMIYFYNRLGNLRINKNLLSPVGRITNKILKDNDRFFGKNFKIHGIDVMDMRDLVKNLIKFSLNKPTNLTLDKVSLFFLKNITKIKLDKGVYELWKNKKFDELAEYNIRDVELLTMLEDKLKLFFYHTNIRNVLPSLNLNETQYNSIIVDKMILKENRNLVFPTKRWSEKLELEGAYVHKTTPGIYKNVGVLDFNALYPNIIRTFNISPDTIRDSNDKVMIDNISFDLENQGILTKLVDNLITQRYEYKKLKNKEISESEKYKVYDSMETAFKAIINSIYGVFGLNSFRLYDNRVASAITFMGRFILNRCIDFVNSREEFQVIRGDTDSVFVVDKKNTNYEDVEKSFEKLSEDINVFIREEIRKMLPEKYHSNVKNLNIECETIFIKLINPEAKKKYLGLVKMFKGKKLEKEVLYGRNIEIIRRDTPDAVKKILNVLMLDILYIDDVNDTKEKIKEAKKEIKNLNYKDLLIVKQINKFFEEYKVLPQHVRAMQYSNKYLNTKFSRDNYKGGMLYVENIPSQKYPSTDVLMLDEDTELPTQFKVNYDKYFDLFVERKLILLYDGFKIIFNKNKTLDMY